MMQPEASPPPPYKQTLLVCKFAALGVVPGGTINLADGRATAERVDPDSVCVGR